MQRAKSGGNNEEKPDTENPGTEIQAGNTENTENTETVGYDRFLGKVFYDSNDFSGVIRRCRKCICKYV